MMPLTVNSPQFTPAASSRVLLNQSPEKPIVASPTSQSVDSFEKVGASMAKNRTGGTFNLNREALENYLRRFYLEEGEAIPRGMIKELLTGVTKKVLKETKQGLPSVMQEGIEPTVKVKLNKKTVVLETKADYDAGVRPFLIGVSDIFRNASGNSSAVPNITPHIEQLEQNATAILDLAVLRELNEKMKIPCTKVEPKA